MRSIVVIGSAPAGLRGCLVRGWDGAARLARPGSALRNVARVRDAPHRRPGARWARRDVAQRRLESGRLKTIGGVVHLPVRVARCSPFDAGESPGRVWLEEMDVDCTGPLSRVLISGCPLGLCVVLMVRDPGRFGGRVGSPSRRRLRPMSTRTGRSPRSCRPEAAPELSRPAARPVPKRGRRRLSRSKPAAEPVQDRSVPMPPATPACGPKQTSIFALPHPAPRRAPPRRSCRSGPILLAGSSTDGASSRNGAPVPGAYLAP